MMLKVYTTRPCPYCDAAKALLKRRQIAFEEILVPLSDTAQWDELARRSGMMTMPQIWAGERLIGGYQELSELDSEDRLESLRAEA